MQARLVLNARALGKQRQRFAGHAYTPTPTRLYEEMVATEYKRQGFGKFVGGVAVRL